MREPSKIKSLLIKGLLRTLALLPLPLAHTLGTLLGTIISWLPSRMMRVTRINLRKCFPQMALAARKQLARRSMVETAKAFMESGAIWLRPTEKLLSQVKQVDDWDLVEQAYRRGRGVIIATLHLGVWEMVGIYGSSRLPMTILYRPPRQAMLEQTIRRARARAGAKVVPTTVSGIRSLYQALQKGETLAMLPDQEPDEGGVFAPFFGIPAYTMLLLPRLARKTGAAVILVHCERLPKGKGFKLGCKDLTHAINAGTMEDAATAVNKGIEEVVRTCPEQYQWAYRRFYKRPPGERRFYSKSDDHD